ncbi:efflux RND transporter periplasmic adaptor subunit [Ferrimonas balearica]|uniref:efflux RND transporter periplasmic adaptor subunit n=1 Tax=Ferrimonas balearica TaxID=44012 RepID=UPI0021BD1332|nr:efflux RND transporter periplasmic adaptor subunit [Ferrimonas balearica]
MRTTITAGMVLVAVLVAGVWYKEQAKSEKLAQARPQGTPTVVAATANTESVRWEVEALGTVRARESVILSAKVTESVQAVHFQDGQRVAQGDLLVTLRDAEQQAKLRAARANLTEHEREFNRIEGLVKTKTIPSNELDKILTDIDIARAQLAQYQAELDARYIYAPFSGLLGFRQISPGALVTPGTAIATLDDLAVVKLDFTVPERFLSQLTPGKSVEGLVAAFPGERFKGTVVSIDSRINPETRAVVVRAEVDNREFKLRPGMLLTLRLIAEERQGLVVPEEAIIPLQRDQFIYVVNADNVVEQRKVTLGLRSRGRVEILEGVADGERVITRGIQKVRPGQTVEVRDSERFTHLEAS